jgi:ABC-type Fe3+ transport system permease subunit
MADYQNRVSSSFSERMRLNRFRRKRERTSFREELRVVPKWLVFVLIFLYLVALGLGAFINLSGVNGAPWPTEFSNDHLMASFCLAGVTTLVAAFFASFILLCGYVYRDAKRRGMQAGLWLLLILVLSPAYLAIGFLLYFFLREPLPYPCPQCGTTVGARFNFCPNCKNNLHPACPECKQEVGELDKFCPNCGSAIPHGGAVAPMNTPDIVST